MQIREFVRDKIVYLSTAIVSIALYIAHFHGKQGGGGSSFLFGALIVFAAVIVVVFFRKRMGKPAGRAGLRKERE